MMWPPCWLDNDWLYSLKVVAHFRLKKVVDLSTYNTQIEDLTGAVIRKAHYNDKYN